MEATLIALFVVGSKSLGMLLLILGGVLAVGYGYRLFQDGAGHGHEALVIKGNGFEVTARSVGSVMMATALGWAYLGVLISPNLEATSDELRIYSFNLPGLSLEAPEIGTTFTFENQELRAIWNQPDFQVQVVNFVHENPDQFRVTMNGQDAYLHNPALTEYPRINLYAAHDITTTTEPSARVTYNAIIQDGRVFLRPIEVTPTGDDAPNEL